MSRAKRLADFAEQYGDREPAVYAVGEWRSSRRVERVKLVERHVNAGGHRLAVWVVLVWWTEAAKVNKWDR